MQCAYAKTCACCMYMLRMRFAQFFRPQRVHVRVSVHMYSVCALLHWVAREYDPMSFFWYLSKQEHAIMWSMHACWRFYACSCSCDYVCVHVAYTCYNCATCRERRAEISGAFRSRLIRFARSVRTWCRQRGCVHNCPMPVFHDSVWVPLKAGFM